MNKTKHLTYDNNLSYYFLVLLKKWIQMRYIRRFINIRIIYETQKARIILMINRLNVWPSLVLYEPVRCIKYWMYRIADIWLIYFTSMTHSSGYRLCPCIIYMYLFQIMIHKNRFLVHATYLKFINLHLVVKITSTILANYMIFVNYYC